jgi:hypothetical protein
MVPVTVVATAETDQMVPVTAAATAAIDVRTFKIKTGIDAAEATAETDQTVPVEAMVPVTAAAPAIPVAEVGTTTRKIVPLQRVCLKRVHRTIVASKFATATQAL